jgi:predicted RNase H-like nuclease
MAVLGVDACKSGWIGIVLDEQRPQAIYASNISDLAAEAGPVDGIAIDIPIGIPERKRRIADELAKQAVGHRRNSVFFTPVRAALLAEKHVDATRVSVELTGAGISQQAWSLGKKIFEVEVWLARFPGRVWEVHPEVSFATLAGRPLSESKTCWAGARERYHLLRAAGIDLGVASGHATRMAKVDDMLDAGAAAWSAQRLVRGKGVSYPDPPEKSQVGRDIAIWA